MSKIKHECDDCGSVFSLTYDEMTTDSDPTYCPFCGEYLLLLNDDIIEEEEDE